MGGIIRIKVKEGINRKKGGMIHSVRSHVSDPDSLIPDPDFQKDPDPGFLRLKFFLKICI
jgi:hypothetical protein